MWHFIKFTNTRSKETKSREVQGRSKGAKKFKGAQIHSLNRNLSSSKPNKRSSLLSPLSSYSSNSPSPFDWRFITLPNALEHKLIHSAKTPSLKCKHPVFGLFFDFRHPNSNVVS